MTSKIGPPLVAMKGISKAFPGVKALDDVDFVIHSGEVVALLGENGAGKSTLMKILGGVYAQDRGAIHLHGEEVRLLSPHHAQRIGIATVYQELNLCPNQEVAASIFTGREPRIRGLLGKLGLVDRRNMRELAAQHLKEAGADTAVDTPVYQLSVAERQKVEIAKALSLDARIMIMDEPTSSLGVADAEALFGIIASLKQQGMGIVFVSHRLDEVFRVADRIVVLRDGRLAGVMPTEEVTVEKVIHMMVGRSVTGIIRAGASDETRLNSEPAVLQVNELSRQGIVERVSFTVRRGEILGMAGLVGSGRTEVAQLLFGMARHDQGAMLLDGKPYAPRSPRDAIEAGVALVPEDRQGQGLILGMAVRENIGLPSLDAFSRFGQVNRRKLRDAAAQVVTRLNIRTPRLDQRVAYLSGGNQQKIVLGKWMRRRLKLLILDEPTRGVDVGAKEEVHNWIRRLAAEGLAILLISSELPELLALSDRVVVMWEGKQAGEVTGIDATQERIMAYASGQF